MDKTSAIAAYLRMSISEKEMLRHSFREKMEAWLEEQSTEWHDSKDTTKMYPKIKCDFCNHPKKIHPSDGFNLCEKCDPVYSTQPILQCFLCDKKKIIRYNIGIHRVCKDCMWLHQKVDCTCVSCTRSDLPASWYKGLIDYYASNLDDLKTENHILKQKLDSTTYKN